MSRRDWGDLLGAVFVLALIGIACRPGSIAPAFITQMGAALTALVGFAASTPGTGPGANGPAPGPGSLGGVGAGPGVGV